MFFEDDDDERVERFLNPEILHVVHRELYAFTANLDYARYGVGVRSVPTHTEDGIPIRKIYVSNLPPKTTRTELFNVFAQYGFIKSCWLRMGDKGPNRIPTPTYAFVTFSNPADAHKALLAPNHEKILRGRSLRISPADSWHQPAEDEDNKFKKPRGNTRNKSHASNSKDPQSSNANGESSTDSNETSEGNPSEETEDAEPTYNILDVLNRDCMTHVLTFIPIIDLIRSERVSKSWQNMVTEYLHSIRTYKTSWWQHEVSLTTAVLRRVLQRLGGSLARLHIDHHLLALNDRTAHSIGKFCPNLEELKVIGMHTKNWNPLLYGCKQLKNLSFISCNKLTDSSLVHLVKNESCIEDLTIANNTHVTGLFLTGSNTLTLQSLAFYNCYNLQGTVLCAAIDTLPNLTTLKLDVCPVTMWKIVPLILKKLPKLEELSLSEYTSAELCLSPQGSDAFCESLSTMTELKSLNLSRNIYINNAVLKQVGQSCHKLETLNVASCNSIRTFPHSGVGDEGLKAVCAGCTALRRLDVSYLGGLSDAGLRCASRLSRLGWLTARGLASLSAASVVHCLQKCHQLEEIDLCGCDNVSEAVISAAVEALDARARPLPLLLRLGGTAASIQETFSLEQDYPSHKLLTVNMHEDRSNPNLRPDFVDRVFDYSSDDSLDDLFDHELYEVQDFDDFLAGGECVRVTRARSDPTSGRTSWTACSTTAPTTRWTTCSTTSSTRCRTSTTSSLAVSVFE
ncbi:F-box/LRR-repeat protein 7-like isoform X2 [Ostrinia nubilalis]|uniref:F-box/LRR-repeat protein 7-like isoform X2 n=1 Tax=Ostrinia nubilalis TaxID=29057 RepID=UPI0030825CC7